MCLGSVRLKPYKSRKPLSKADYTLNNTHMEARRAGKKSCYRRGAAMFEIAMALVPFLALSFAIFDFAMPIFIRTMLTNAVREGTRYAITYQTRTGLTQSQSIQQVVQEQSVGFLSGSTGLNLIKVRFYSPTTFVEQTGSNRNAGGNIVEVSVEGYSWKYMLPLWRSSAPVQIHATSSDRLEMLPASAARPAP